MLVWRFDKRYALVAHWIFCVVDGLVKMSVIAGFGGRNGLPSIHFNSISNMIKLIQTIVLLTLCTHAIGGGILGAHLECKPYPDTFNGYIITLSLYVDGASEELNEPTQLAYLVENDMRWKSDGTWQCYRNFEMKRVSSTKIQQNPLKCNATSKREIFLILFEGYIGFGGQGEQAFMNDGCIIAWHSTLGYRGKGDKNFVESSDLAEWVTTFLPPLMVDDFFSTMKSSPTIGSIRDFVICKDELAEIKFPATKVDGDELRYRLSIPYGITDVDFEGTSLNIKAGDWTWANGYSEQNPMHGNPALGINENTGVITVKPSEEGQYFVAISVDEYRNGEKTGTVNFYYTLTVVGCNQQQVWNKDIYQDTTAIQSLTICKGSQATLTSKQTFPGPKPEFQWTKNGKTIWGATSQSLTISEEGNYQLLTTKIDGCPDSFDSETVHVIVASSSGAEMDSIPPICDINGPTVALNATPFGGTFAGVGVIGNTFDPGVAGVGRHEIAYAFQGSADCPGSVAKREVIVSEMPALDLINVLYTSRGKSIQIGVKDSLELAYQWTPPDYLNSDVYANPTSTPAGSIIYTVTATNAYGCAANREVQVKIIESILIPDAFTPNGDGINETWELKGIESYPNCRVTIYNRWGEVIFHSKGYQNAFDGTVAGALQMPGVYAYKIRLTENSPELTGALTLIR